jgi:hypothetical protein
MENVNAHRLQDFILFFQIYFLKWVDMGIKTLNFTLISKWGIYLYSSYQKLEPSYCTVGWVDIGTGTKVPPRFVTFLSKVTKINEKSVLTQ